jgi:hypothetical protein
VTKNTPIAFIASLILIIQLIGGTGCLVGKSESESFIAAAHEAINANIKWLDEQKFISPDPPAPLDVAIDSLESNTSRIGRDSVAVNANTYVIGDIGAGTVGGGGG